MNTEATELEKAARRAERDKEKEKEKEKALKEQEKVPGRFSLFYFLIQV